MKNFFLSIEGIEGVGKTTSMQFLQQYLASLHIPVVATREPGGTVIAEQIRKIILSHHEEPMGSDTELLLMFASRAQHVVRVIKPALEKGNWVLCDRFTDATYAYQGGGRGISSQRISLLENWVLGEFKPDTTILLVAPVETAMERAAQRGQADRIESEKIEFFSRVQQTYLQRAQSQPERFYVIDAMQPFTEVQKNLQQIIQTLLT